MKQSASCLLSFTPCSMLYAPCLPQSAISPKGLAPCTLSPCLLDTSRTQAVGYPNGAPCQTSFLKSRIIWHRFFWVSHTLEEPLWHLKMDITICDIQMQDLLTDHKLWPVEKRGVPLRDQDKSIKASSAEKSKAVPWRFHVWAYKRRIWKLEVTICDLQSW